MAKSDAVSPGTAEAPNTEHPDNAPVGETPAEVSPPVTLDNFDFEETDLPDEVKANPAVSMLVQSYVANGRQAQEHVNYLGKIKAPADIVARLRSEGDPVDDKVAAFRTFYEAQSKALEDAVKVIDAHLLANHVGETNEEEVTKRKDLLKGVRDQSSALVKVLEGFGVPEEILPALPSLRGTGGGSSSTGTKRPRVSSLYIDGTLIEGPEKKDAKTGEVTRNSTFTALAQALTKKDKDLKVEVADLQSAALEALKVSDWADAKDKSADFGFGKFVIRVVV